ncbi:DUF2339 domain-containing protein [Chryseobacterium panacisoli]|uniref:DUF2339 domain-containing protein n=1 Tax=Chryseobacterium panacisoli TaxID=1807141 RepID=A0A5D8ZLE8_9FLAO|nr:DUF2339 domain-containing protein [Chryseobacterium panacisoli]TZF94993.1 DUF2339 domain-containing protein [Chryseobacterium panacisoli]
MNELVAVIILIVIFIIFNNLNTKIRRLEKEISDLNHKINKAPAQSEVIHQKISAEETIVPQQVQSHQTVPEAIKNGGENEEIPTPAQKDWLTPVFDFLKQNALTIIGIFTLVLGIGYFVKYAIDKNWIGKTARAGIGFCTGAGIIIIGHFLRKNYTAFASIITGGGITVLYFTATIAFREYHLFTQNTAFVTTALITAASIILSYYYKSEVLIIFSLIGGFSAPLMISTGQSNYPFLFIYLTLLNIGMLVVSFLQHWKSVGWAAYIFTTAYLFYWTNESPELLSITFYMISYVIFYLFALHDYIRKGILSTSDILILAFANFSSVLGLLYIFDTLGYEPPIIFPLIFAAVNSILLFREYGRKNSGAAYSVFAGLVTSLITIAVAIQFKTHLITSIWAIETTLLLFIWKKTGHKIFKTFFYILFPLVMIAQIVTWTEYLGATNFNIIFNPPFITSSFTIISIMINLYLLRNKGIDSQEKVNTFFEDLITVISYGVIYISFLLEITYHVSEMPWSAIVSIGLLFSIFYLFVLLLFRKPLSIRGDIQAILIYLFFVLITLNTSVSTLPVITAVLTKKLHLSFYVLHLLQWIPFIYVCSRIIPSSEFHKARISYWILSLALIISVSCELHHSYVLMVSNDIPHSYEASAHFNILYLPIIWTVLASIFIYMGLKKNIQEYNKVGFALIGLMVLKLYGYDVWQMDNISRISAFIALGIILLLSSFAFQRLKNIIRNMVDKKGKSEETTD